MANSNVIISLEHVSKWFGNKQVLSDISLEIKQGEFVTFLGPSGCGKSTTLRLIAGFLEPDEGRILLGGEDISGVPPYKRALNTVFQRYALFPHMDVFDNVAFGLKLSKLPEKEIEKKVKKALKMVNMTGYEDRDVNSLSGGQQQRVAVARAIVNQPKVLLLDEPLAALDLKMRKDMQLELKEMHQKLGITFIYVTHDQEEALNLSDTVVVMKAGKIHQVGTPIDIYNEPVNAFVADFIGDSNILSATMIEDRKVSFIGHEFECVDEGFGKNEKVDVVIRPEDIYLLANLNAAQFTGVVKSCVFKGIHYEMFIETDNGYELQVLDYNAFAVGSTVGLLIRPQDIQVMHDKFVTNIWDGVMVDSTHVDMIGGIFECRETGLAEGDRVKVEVQPEKVDMMDNEEEGTVCGYNDMIIYKGDHYSIHVMTEDGFMVQVSTNDVWDKNDTVGIRILPKDIKITKLEND